MTAAQAIELADRTRLFTQSNLCSKCAEPIADVDEAILVNRADGTQCLIHFTPECYSREIQAMLETYLAQPRVKWVTRASEQEHTQA